MRLNNLLAAGLLVVWTMVGLSTSAWAQQWESYPVLSNPGIGGLRAAESWINNTCKPDQIGDVVSFLSQEGTTPPHNDYNIYVFCKHGNGGVKVTATPYGPYNKGSFDPQSFMNSALQGRSVSIIGIYAGAQNEIFFFQKQ
jgi:hypothetical protein